MNWKDTIRTEPTLRRITKQDGSYEDVYITDIPSNVTQQGTPINSPNMQYLDDGMSGNKANIGTSEYTIFSTTSTYDVGDIVIYNNIIYRCILEVTTPGSFNSENWETYSIKKMFEQKEQELQALAEQLQQDIKDNVINSLNSELIDGALSANQGRILNGKINGLKGTILFQNTNGIVLTQSIELNDDTEEYDYIEIIYGKGNEAGLSSVICYPNFNKYVSISIYVKTDPAGKGAQFICAKLKLEENRLIQLECQFINLHDSLPTSINYTNEMRIFQVTGYKKT